ncbi:hypothetical protein K502DRAFT_344895 [Neoconidiobolus thromboides FSU 785]|nr:hypothetical protein K502DRAFT_344895 [Neoconidiobolus thromboides FSU 785]
MSGNQQLCRYFPQGKCHKGNSCPFSHALTQTNGPPPKPATWEALSVQSIKDDFANFLGYGLTSYGPVMEQQNVVVGNDFSPEKLKMLCLEEFYTTGKIDEFNRGYNSLMSGAFQLVNNAQNMDPNFIIQKLHNEKIQHEAIAQNLYDIAPNEKQKAKEMLKNLKPNFGATIAQQQGQFFNSISDPLQKREMDPRAAPIKTDKLFGSGSKFANEEMLTFASFAPASKDAVPAYALPAQNGGQNAGFNSFSNPSQPMGGFPGSNPVQSFGFGQPQRVGLDQLAAQNPNTTANQFNSPANTTLNQFNSSGNAGLNQFNSTPNTGVNQFNSLGNNALNQAKPPVEEFSFLTPSKPTANSNSNSNGSSSFSFLNPSSVSSSEVPQSFGFTMNNQIKPTANGTPKQINSSSGFDQQVTPGFDMAKKEESKVVPQTDNKPTPLATESTKIDQDQNVENKNDTKPFSFGSFGTALPKVPTSETAKQEVKENNQNKESSSIEAKPFSFGSLNATLPKASTPDTSNKETKENSNSAAVPLNFSSFGPASTKVSSSGKSRQHGKAAINKAQPLGNKSEDLFKNDKTPSLPKEFQTKTDLFSGKNIFSKGNNAISEDIFGKESQSLKIPKATLGAKERQLIKEFDSFYNYEKELANMSLEDITKQLDDLIFNQNYTSSSEPETAESISTPIPFEATPSKNPDYKKLPPLLKNREYLNPSLLASPSSYTRREALYDWEVEAFQCEEFEKGKIPIHPPSIDFLIMK